VANRAKEAVPGRETRPVGGGRRQLSSVTVCRRLSIDVLPLIVAILVVTSGSGCSLVSRRSPVPPELADARRLCNEGLAAADRQDLARAEGLLEQAVRNCPVDVDARQHYADVLWQRGEKTEAVAQVARALELSPADAGLCVKAGGMYLELGLFAEADRLAREAVHLAPQSAEAWQLHGRVALARGQPEPALADFHRALALAPEQRETLLDTAEAYRRLDRPQRALATLAVLGETYGPNELPAEVLVLEGLAQEALGRRGDAVESYRRAVAMEGAPAEATARLAALEQASTDVIARRPEGTVR
jgi:tetratricopeptide (TPR) repeat protein